MTASALAPRIHPGDLVLGWLTRHLARREVRFMLTVGRTDTDAQLVMALREGDEAAFLTLVKRHQPLMLRVARSYVHDPRAAEDVVQETWIALLERIDAFEGRATLKTWLFRVLVNRSITRAQRDRRTLPFCALEDDSGEGDDGPTVDPTRFLDPEHPRWPGHWASDPPPLPEQRLLARETLDRVRAAIDALPARQRSVIVLRDIGGFSAEEACDALDVSEANQRVLLHRARAKVREELERYLT
jgi:RNA polymerase sigma-70 factor (ECF subfamily)